MPPTRDGRPGKILVDHLLPQADGLENLRAAIGLDRRDAHLGHHFDHALVDRLVVAFHRILVSDVRQQTFVNHVVQALVSEVRVNRLHAIAEQQTEMMHFARLAGLEHEPDPRARTRANQMMVQPGRGQQRRNRRMGLVDALIGKNQNRRAFGDLVIGGLEQSVQRLYQSLLALARIEQDRQRRGANSRLIDSAELFHIGILQDRFGQVAAVGSSPARDR